MSTIVTCRIDLAGGTKELTNFDVYAAAGGSNKTLVCKFPVSITDGVVSIRQFRRSGRRRYGPIPVELMF